MAVTALKHPENVPGKYYINDDCIDCNLCAEISPEHFVSNPEGGYHIVVTQPSDPHAVELLNEAIESCPTSAIGDDGKFIQ